MLKINKNAVLKQVHYNITFLFRAKSLDEKFLLKKKASQVVTLRSPKHFNIGKHKVLSVNSKALNVVKHFNKPVHISFLLRGNNTWASLGRVLENNIYFLPKTLSIKISTKFKIKWLGF